MNKGKVIFIDSVHPILKERLEQMGFVCDWKVELSREEVENCIGDYTGAVIRSKFLFDRGLIQKAKKLKFIARSGSGMENIDTDFAKSRGVKCYNSPEGNRNAVAEHCVAMLLALFRNLVKANFELRENVWKREKNRGVELEGKTIGIIGYGNTGKTFARKLRSFGVEILAYDKYLKDFADKEVKECSLDEIKRYSDVISLHVPYTEETKYLIDDTFINQCKKNLYLINTSRGKCLNTEDLVRNLKTGKVKGACLDVLEYESISFESISNRQSAEIFHYLNHSDKVILSPHIAGWTQESYFKLSSILADKIQADFAN